MKTLAALAATLAILSGWPAAAAEGSWIAVENQPCQRYNPGPVPGETFTWSGACVDGKTSGRGRGVWRFPDGKETVFKGEHRAGKRHGHGVVTFSDGSHYEGEFRDGKLDGHGVRTWSNGSHYEGEFRDDQPNGQGVMVGPAARYEGEVRDGKAHGQGVMVYRSGSHYEGEFRNDKLYSGFHVCADGTRRPCSNGGCAWCPGDLD